MGGARSPPSRGRPPRVRQAPGSDARCSVEPIERWREARTQSEELRRSIRLRPNR
jgi:hypothetical protein